jgi:hypothetical protein
LTYEEALKSTKYFSELPGVIKIYRDSDIVIDSGGVLRPTAPSVSIASPSNEKDEPLSGFAIFGLVVLGVIVAILLMSTLALTVLSWLGMPKWLDTIAKIIIDSLLYLLSYRVQNKWVFPPEKESK